MNIWVFAPQRMGRLHASVDEVLSLGRRMADSGKAKLSAVLAGHGVESHAAGLLQRGADEVLLLDHEALKDFLDEPYAAALAELVTQKKPEILLFPATPMAHSLAGRLASVLGVGFGPEVWDVKLDGSGGLTAKRACYGGSRIAEIRFGPQRPCIVTVRAGAYPPAKPDPGRQGQILRPAVDPGRWKVRSRFLRHVEETKEEVDISEARIIVSGGRGCGGPDGFKPLRELARALGAAVGASRAAVDAGWIPYKHQVGLTGRTVHPKIYIACGISGQIQHLAGMSTAEVIVAINKDPNCPMMKLANFSVEGDLFEILPALTEEVRKTKSS